MKALVNNKSLKINKSSKIDCLLFFLIFLIEKFFYEIIVIQL
jgi:hypothetical protein